MGIFSRVGDRALDRMDFERLGRNLIAFHPPVEAIAPMLLKASREIPGLATVEAVQAIYGWNPDALFALAKSSGNPEALRSPAGFIAQLPLNKEGHEALFTGELDTSAPDLRFLSKQNEIPSAIYIWGIYVDPLLAGAISLVMERLSSRKNRVAPLYCKATSDKSRTFFLTLGFKTRAELNGRSSEELMVYEREVASDRSTASESSRIIKVKIVHTMDELSQAFAIRAATYMAEHDCPYTEEYDGNDFTATHLIGYIDNEPAGCLRIRYFAEFAKLERLAVAPRFRKSRLAFALVKAAIKFCQRKGYRKLYGHSEERVAPLWRRFGFTPREGRNTFQFSDRTYREGHMDLPAADDALTINSDPYILLRPEGDWDEPGVLDKSATRMANARPNHAKEKESVRRVQANQ